MMHYTPQRGGESFRNSHLGEGLELALDPHLFFTAGKLARHTPRCFCPKMRVVAFPAVTVTKLQTGSLLVLGRSPGNGADFLLDVLNPPPRATPWKFLPRLILPSPRSFCR